MAGDSFRKHCWLAVVMVVYGTLLSLRGMGMHDLMSPSQVRLMLSAMIYVALLAIGAFLMFRKYYLSNGHINEAPKLFPDESQTFGNTETTYGSFSKTQSAKTAAVYVDPSKPTLNSISFFMSENSHIMAIYIFGGGSVVLNFFHAFYSSQCLAFFKDKEDWNLDTGGEEKDVYSSDDEEGRVISTVTKMIFFVVQIAFLHYLSTFSHTACKTTSQYLLLPIMGANVAIWLYTFLLETKLLHIFTFEYPKIAYTDSLGTACLNHSTVVEVYIRSSIDKVFYPMSMEFCLTSMEIMYHVYFLHILGVSPTDNNNNGLYKTQIMDHIKNIDNSVEHRIRFISFMDMDDKEQQETASTVEQTGNCNILIMVPDTKPVTRRKSKLQTVLHRYITLLNPCTALILGLIEASLIKIYLLHYDVLEDGHLYASDHYIDCYITLPLVLFRWISNCILPNFVICTCIFIVKKFEKETSSKHGIKWSIVLGLVASTVTGVHQIAVSIEKLRNPGDDDDYLDTALYVLGIFEYMGYWVQYLLQVFLIFHGGRRKADQSNALNLTLQAGLSYLAMHNFIHWGIYSFLETEFVKNRNHLSESGQNFSDLLVHLTLPLVIYFRYTCTFVLLEIQHRLQCQEVKQRKWQLAMDIVPSQRYIMDDVDTSCYYHQETVE